MLLDKQDVLGLLNISESTLYRRMKMGYIKRVDIGGTPRYQLVDDPDKPLSLTQPTPMSKTWRSMDADERLLRVEGLITEVLAVLHSLKEFKRVEPEPEPEPVELSEEEKKKIEARRKRKATTDKIRSQVEKAVAAFNEIANVGGRKRTFKPQGKAGKQARARFKEGFTVEDLLLVAQWATDIASSGISPQEASRFGRYSWGFAQPDAKARVTPYVLWNDKFEERLDEARQWKEEPAPASNSYEEGWV